ncbi:MAG: phage minor capsid protein [Ruminococcus sp.]|nr:phage minor capsid protein [Ruminococcus sp.]
MLTPNELEVISMMLNKPMRELEMRIMEDIVRRIKINGEITRAADWQITRLSQLGMSRQEIQDAIQEVLGFTPEEMQKLYRNAVESGYIRSEELYNAVGKELVPFAENYGLQQLISSVSEQTLGTLQNITQSLGFAVRQPGGSLKFEGLADYYQKTLDSAMLDIASGAFDYNTVLKRTVKEMTCSGLRSVDYASGWSNRADVAARRSVMIGISQLAAKVNEDNARELDTDWFEVTWHSGARPSHQVWQGKWYTRRQLEEICGLGKVDGLCGANCYHDYYPVIPGISEPTYTEEELAEMNAAENVPVEYGSRTYTKYEAQQRQRRLETTMRAQRQEIKLLQNGGADEDDIINARARYRAISHEYAQFSEAMGIPQQRERVTVDGLGNIGVGKYKKPLTNAAGKPIIKVKNSKLVSEPNSITQKTNKKGGIDRNYYGNDGNQIKQVTNNNHGNPKKHPYGKHGEHAHDYFYDKDGNLIRGEARELTDIERKENEDIL